MNVIEFLSYITHSFLKELQIKKKQLYLCLCIVALLILSLHYFSQVESGFPHINKQGIAATEISLSFLFISM